MWFIRVAQTKLLGVALVLIVALAAAVRIQTLRLERQQQRTTQVALEASNALAERDSTHNVALDTKTRAKLLGDSLRLVEKQVIQITQKADALDHVVNRERVAKYALSVTLDSLRFVVVSEAKGGGLDAATDTRRASFTFRSDPFTVNAMVEIPPPPDSVRMALSVDVYPFELKARVGCSPPDRNGIRRATVMTTSPEWAEVRLNRIEQSPDICRAPPARSLLHGRWRFTIAPVVGIGRAHGLHGTSTWGLMYGAAILIRR